MNSFILDHFCLLLLPLILFDRIPLYCDHRSSGLLVSQALSCQASVTCCTATSAQHPFRDVSMDNEQQRGAVIYIGL